MQEIDLLFYRKVCWSLTFDVANIKFLGISVEKYPKKTFTGFDNENVLVYLKKIQ